MNYKRNIAVGVFLAVAGFLIVRIGMNQYSISQNNIVLAANAGKIHELQIPAEVDGDDITMHIEGPEVLHPGESVGLNAMTSMLNQRTMEPKTDDSVVAIGHKGSMLPTLEVPDKAGQWWFYARGKELSQDGLINVVMIDHPGVAPGLCIWNWDLDDKVGQQTWVPVTKWAQQEKRNIRATSLRVTPLIETNPLPESK